MLCVLVNYLWNEIPWRSEGGTSKVEREKIFQELKNILKDTVTVEEEEITMESDLVNDLNLDSLDLVDLALSVEQVFGFEFSDEQLQQIKTVKDVVDIIESNLYTK